MLSDKEKEYIYKNSYVPEHVADYGETITGGEAFLLHNYLSYSVEGQLFFVGYPLQGSFKEKHMMEALNAMREKIKPEIIALIAPTVPLLEEKCENKDSDQYYRLDVSGLDIDQKIRNMIHRASKELAVEKGREIRDEHKNLISEFLASHPLDEERRVIFEKIPEYIASVSTAYVFNAIDKKGNLVAFDVAEFGSREYAFYLFNFRSSRYSVPGASDLLLSELIKMAAREGKSHINLGLGINEGNRFFKEKWGGVPFLDYAYCQYPLSKREGLLSLLMKFSILE